MFYQTQVLKNGIRLVHKPDECTVAYCGMVINTGTRDEAEHEQGMAHFVEHMLFKGTKKRNSAQIINRLEDVGGEINAYTTKEETFVYAIVPTDFAERAVELVGDIVFNSVFPDKEIEKEIEVVLDEIQSYNDSPSELIFDDFDELIFPYDTIGRNILGNHQTVSRYKKEALLRFLANNYSTDEMVFFSLGKWDIKKWASWAEKYWGDIPSTTRKQARTAPSDYRPAHRQETKDTFQVHSMLGNRAYDFQHPSRLGLYLLNNIIGGPGMSSLLNMSIREQNGLAYNVESNFTPYTDTGVFSVYVGCDKKNQKKCEELVHKELRKLREQKISAVRLAKYKQQLMGQLTISSENKETFALTLGKSFLHFNKMDGLNEVRQNLDLITADHLLHIANEVFDEKKLSSLVYL
jgi:predicted Zn-dependent peptidase